MNAKSVILAIPAVLIMAYGAYISIVGIVGVFRAPTPFAVAGPTFNCFVFYIAMVGIYLWLSRGLHRKLLRRFSLAVLLCISVPVLIALFHGTTER